VGIFGGNFREGKEKSLGSRLFRRHLAEGGSGKAAHIGEFALQKTHQFAPSFDATRKSLWKWRGACRFGEVFRIDRVGIEEVA
jgi:hypothetical protein